MDIKKLQQELDLKKWYESIKQQKDTCGTYSYCAYCDITLEDPCANAYVKQESVEQKAEAVEKKPARAKAEPKAKKAPAKKESAPKAKKAPAKKESAPKAKKAPAKKAAKAEVVAEAVKVEVPAQTEEAIAEIKTAKKASAPKAKKASAKKNA